METLAFLGDARRRLRAVEIVAESQDETGTFHRSAGTVQQLPAQLALIALGFTVAEPSRLLDDPGVAIDLQWHRCLRRGLHDQR